MCRKPKEEFNQRVKIIRDLSVKGFLDSEEAEQVIRKELSPRSVEKWQLLRIGI